MSVEAVGDRVSFAKHILEAHRSLLASGSLAYSANTQRLAEGATPFAVARALGIDRKTVLKYAGHLQYQPQHQPKAGLAAE